MAASGQQSPLRPQKCPLPTTISSQPEAHPVGSSCGLSFAKMSSFKEGSFWTIQLLNC